METQIGSLPAHKFHHLTEVNPEFAELPNLSNNLFKYMVEVYVDDFVALAMARSRGQLCHVATGVMTNKEDDISLKKFLKKGGA